MDAVPSPAGEGGKQLVPAGDRGDDGERIGGSDGGCLLGGQVADVFVVQIQVNKCAHLALGGEQVLAEIGMRVGEGFESPGDGGRVDFYGVRRSRQFLITWIVPQFFLNACSKQTYALYPP